MPSAIVAAIEGRPFSVAGILISALGRSMVCESFWAMADVASASWARRGSTSMDTRPSTPWVAWAIGVNRSHASRTSSVVMRKTASSTDVPALANSETCSR